MSRKERSGSQNVRLLRVGENLRHALDDILRRDPPPHELLERTPVTITAVDVSPDLRNAKVFFTPLGGLAEEGVLEALNEESGYLQHRLGREIRLKYTPRLRFELDKSFETGDRIDDLLNSPRVRKDVKAPRDGEA